MSPIKVLDSAIQNKIAAGEVVERPSSVVKELAENSIDAHATQVEVFIEESGMKQIRIVDNGDGIHHTDGPLLFQRHATSKIDTDYDLFQIRSLGFRGEALASIGAVAKVTVETKHTAGNPVFIRFEGGNLVEQIPGKERQGTDITITDLFFNTPARLKYMRSMRTESGKIIDIIQRMALANPGISFRLVLDGQEKIMTKGNGNLKEVISDIYGLNVARHAVEIEAHDADFDIRGYAIRPEINRSNRNYLNISVNRRFIKNFMLSQSIVNAYHTLLPKDKYPIVVIDIKMDPKLVDVNVHP
ncbi:DNA mismatch repair endonuclease MutL, partial [Salinicoccus roseus]